MLALFVLAACAPVQYQPQELDPHRLPEEYAKRDVQQEGLAQFAAQSGLDDPWPPERWSLPELATVALYFDPRVRSARSRSNAARAQLDIAASRQSISLAPVIEHHSEQLQGDTPWSVGVALELPWVARGRRDAQVAKAAALADAAQLGIAQAVWQSRAAVRDGLIELLDARRGLEQLEHALAVRGEMRDLVARRVEAGMLSARELGQEEAVLNAVEAEVVVQRARLQSARADLAGALGLPREALERIVLADEPLAMTPPETASALRARALRNRLDIQQRLLEFAAADAALRSAVAAQYPELSLSPGYLWDQADSVWSLVAHFVLPSAARTRGQIAQAAAERELAAQRFLELQSAVIARAEQTWTALEGAREQRIAAARQAQSANARLQRAQRLFDRGAADRLELTAARLTAAASADFERRAAAASRKALAAAEDLMQEPLPREVQAVSGAAR